MLLGQEFGYNAPWVSFMTCKMKILTDNPDWALDIYEARALAMMFLRKRGRAGQGAPCLQATSNALTVTYYLYRSPMHLTVDTHTALAY
jgi:hypothetical protein